MGKKAPKAPDPMSVANANAEANRLNVFGPLGNLQYGTVGEDGTFTANNSGAAVQYGTPEQRQLYDRFAGGLLSSFTNPRPDNAGLTVSQLSGQAGLGGVRSGNQIESSLAQGGNINELYNGFAGDSAAVRNALYQKGLNQLQPQLDENRGRLEQTLADRGISIDSDAYRSQQDRFDRAQNEQLNNLSLSAVLAGSGEQDRLFNQALSRFGAAQGQRQQSLAEQLGLGGYESGLAQQQFNNSLALRAIQDAERDRQYGQAAGFLGIQPQAPNTAQTDIAGLSANNFAAQNAAYGANNQALGSLGGLALGGLLGGPFGGGLAKLF